MVERTNIQKQCLPIINKKISKIDKKQKLIEDELQTNEEKQINLQNLKIQNKSKKQEINKQNNNQSLSQKQNKFRIEEDSDSEVQNYAVEDCINQQSVLSHEKIFEIATSLLMKNKVNSKNAFEIPIPSVTKMKEFKDLEGDFGWKKLSNTLECEAKIYGFRVDGLQERTYHMIGNINRAKETEQILNTNKNDDNDQIDDPNDENFIVSKIKSFKGTKTLESNPENLNCNKYDLEYEMDPLFQKQSAKFDEGGSVGLLLHRLEINQIVQLMLDSESLHQKKIQTKQKKIQQVYSDLKDLKISDSTIKKLFKCDISPELINFRNEINQKNPFDIDPSKIKSQDIKQKPSEIIQVYTECVPYEDPFEPIYNESNLMAEMDILIPQNEQSNNQIDEVNEVEDESKDSFKNDQLQDEQQNDLIQENNQNENQTNNQNSKNPLQNLLALNYLNSKLTQIGIGRYAIEETVDLFPVEDFILSKRIKPKNQSNEPQSRIKKNIDYTKIDFDMQEELDMDELFKYEKQIEIDENDEKDDLLIQHQHLLPLDSRINIQKFTNNQYIDIETILKKMQQQKEANEDLQQQQEDEAINDDQNQNQNDVEFQFFHENKENDMQEENNEFNFNQNLNKDNDLNELVKQDLNKKSVVQVKELKEKIWVKLDKVLNKVPQKQDKQKKQKQEVQFSQLVSNLPNILGDKQSKIVSIQTSFVTLLHLCNEQQLRLIQQEDMDFNIYKE